MRPPRRLRALTSGLAVVAMLAVGLVAVDLIADTDVDCPPGTIPTSAQEPRLVPPDQRDQLPPEYLGPMAQLELRTIDCRPARVESFEELTARNAQNDARISAPFMAPAPGARLAAAEQRMALMQARNEVPGATGTLEPYGEGPLNFDEDPYDSGQGIVDSTGRIDDFFYDPTNDRLFAAIGTSGVWLSEDLGETWQSIGESLPTQVTSAVSWSPVGGPDGTIVLLTGEHTFGGAAFTGLGAFWSTDLGETWTRAEGPPDGTLGFAIEVDPTDGDIVYAATGKGLWRSTDAGRTYTDVRLPVGRCEGDYRIETCNYAHFVTDLVIKEPGGVGPDTAGGSVLAAVGYRAGMLEDVSGGFIHSEGNGLYRSDSGEPGTFEVLPAFYDAIGGQERMGRVEMGQAVGPEQNHDIVYALVQDAVYFNGGSRFDFIPDGADPTGLLGAPSTFLNGVYVSEDWGTSWTLLADDTEMAGLCTVNRSVFCIPGLIEPGAQAWYNQWIAPDPTRQVGGVPTRIVLGLEEVFQNRGTNLPANTPLTSFEVIGAYYGGVDCLLVATDCAVSSNLDIETTHPDQHDGIFIPTLGEDGEPDGGVRLLVGHDGGISRQVSTGPLDEFSQMTWDLDQEESGLRTLLPYSIAAADDGTVLGGLQDNGTMMVDPTRGLRQYEVQGADGTATAIDPEDSSYGYASSQTNSLLGVSTDRFLTFTPLTPTPSDGTFLFVPPLDMNPTNSDHILTGGRLVIENLAGREATADTWSVAIDLGTSEREPLFETDAPPPGRQTSATALYGDAAYVGYCAPCNILQSAYPYDSGIATNIGGDALPEPGTDAGWHIAAAEGLPERYVTDLAIDPYDPSGRTVYATLGGYTRKWVPPGTGADQAEDVGEGHVYVSTDGGETFRNISGNLPDTPVLTVEQRGGQLLVGTDLGAFISADLTGSSWAPLGDSPAIPVMDIQLQADDPSVAYLGVYGRGVMRYTFPDDVPAPVRRLAGADREGTSVAVSRDVYTRAETVVIARSDQYADALAGAPLAYDRGAPLLLTASGALNPAVSAEVARLGATRAVLLGGTTALSPQVEQDLRAAGITEVERIGGANRFETAALVADALGTADQAWVVKGNDADPTRGWEDAMSIAAVAARGGDPILLVETDRLPEETAAALADVPRARLVGGTAAVSAAVEQAVGQIATVGARVAGDNRFATSVAAVEAGRAMGANLSSTWLARADAFADALSAGPSVAATGGSLLLVDRTSLGASLEAGQYLRDNACAIRLARIAGGTAAIGDGVAAELRQLLDACPVGVQPPPAQQILPPEELPAPDGGEGDEGAVIAGPFDFEADAQGWTVEGGDPLTGTWTRGGPGADSGTSFQVAPYGDLAATSLVSPPIEVDGSRVTASWRWALQMEGGGFDEVVVEWTQDGGTTWTAMTSLGKTADFPAFADGTGSFTPDPGTVQIRFRLFADEICSSLLLVPGVCADTALDGAYVDDVVITR